MRPALAILQAASLCGLVAWGGGAVLLADAGAPYQGRRLVQVLRELDRNGLDLIFSSAVVPRSLRIDVEPEATDPREVLDEILPSLGLATKDGPSGAILIVPATTSTGNVGGRVVSLSGARPIAGATVRIPALGLTTATDTDGSFEMRRVPAGTWEMYIHATGFTTASFSRVRITAGGDLERTIKLEAHPSFVTEVVVTPGRHSLVRAEQASRHTVTNDEAVLAPTTGGDIARVIELLPGVTAADGSAAFNVRGGVASDVSLVLDGLELYDAFHLQSFQSPFSLIDSNVVDRIDFFGGGFTAERGDRHGGFVDISTLVPDAPASAELELGTLNSRLSYQAQMSRRPGSWLLSARGWYPDAVHDSTELGGGENLDPRFGDLYLKAALVLSSRHTFSAHGLASYDRLNFREAGEDINERVDAVTRNAYVWMRLFSAWSDRISTETVWSAGRIDRERDGIAAEDGAVNVDDDRVVDFLGLRHDATFKISDRNLIKAGADVRWLDAEYRYSSLIEDEPEDSTLLRLDPDGVTLGIYASHRVRLAQTIATEVGLRWDRQDYTNDNQLSPRFNAFWRASDRSELRLALGRFNQSQRIHELRVEDGETRFGRAETAEQAELSWRHSFRRGPKIRLDAYYRKLTHLRPRYENLFEPIELFPETAEDRGRIAPRSARLRGLELLLRGDVNRPFFWWASYALSSADDNVDGRQVRRSWDQKHAGKVLLGYRRDERWSISLSGSVHTGWPTTPITGELVTQPDGSTEIEAVLGERNADRFDAYSRVDLKARHSFELPRGRLWLTVEVVNLLDRNNACCLDDVFFEELGDGSIETSRKDDYWLGVTPSFSVLWEF